MKSNQAAAAIPYLALLAALALAGCADPLLAPAAPGAAALVPGEYRLTLDWEPVEGATAYEVWYGTQEDPAAAIQSGGDIPETAYDLTGLTRGMMYHVWLKAKNEAGASDFGPVASSNEGEWTLFWVSFSKKQISFRKNYDNATGGHLLNTAFDNAYNVALFGPQGQVIVENLGPTWIVEENFNIGTAVRIYNGNNYDIYSNAVAIEE